MEGLLHLQFYTHIMIDSNNRYEHISTEMNKAMIPKQTA